MVRTSGLLRLAFAIAEGRPDPDPDPWGAGQGSHLSDQHARPENSTELMEARGKVGDLDHASLSVLETGFDHGRVGSVALLGFGEVEQFYLVESPVAVPVIVEEGAETRIAVESRQAAPDNLAARVDEGTEVAIADDREIKRAQGVGPLFNMAAGSTRPAGGRRLQPESS